MSLFLVETDRIGGTVMRVKRWLLRVRHLIALRKPENSLSWQQQAGSEAKSSFLVLVSFSSACEFTQLCQMWVQSCLTEPLGYWLRRSKSSLGAVTSLLRSVKAMRSSRERWLSLMFIWSQRQAIYDFPYAFCFSSRLRGGLMRYFQRGELSQTMLVSPWAQWLLRKQRQSARQLVEGWSSSMIIRCPLERELVKMASRSGWPKQHRWLGAPLSSFLKEDFIINFKFLLQAHMLYNM